MVVSVEAAIARQHDETAQSRREDSCPILRGRVAMNTLSTHRALAERLRGLKPRVYAHLVELVVEAKTQCTGGDLGLSSGWWRLLGFCDVGW